MSVGSRLSPWPWDLQEGQKWWSQVGRVRQKQCALVGNTKAVYVYLRSWKGYSEVRGGCVVSELGVWGSQCTVERREVWVCTMV